MKKGIIALMACVFALVMGVALVGCGSGSDPKAAWVGTWDLTEMEENGEVTGADDLEMLKALGLDVYLELNQDGTGALVLFGEATEFSWEAKSSTEASFTMDGQTAGMKLTDGNLTIEQSGSKLTFQKGEARSASAASSAASSEASESASASSASSAS